MQIILELASEALCVRQSHRQWFVVVVIDGRSTWVNIRDNVVVQMLIVGMKVMAALAFMLEAGCWSDK